MDEASQELKQAFVVLGAVRVTPFQPWPRDVEKIVNRSITNRKSRLVTVREQIDIEFRLFGRFSFVTPSFYNLTWSCLVVCGPLSGSRMCLGPQSHESRESSEDELRMLENNTQLARELSALVNWEQELLTPS